MRRLARWLTLVAVSLAATQISFAQDVFRHENASIALEQRFDWAHQQASQQGVDKYWIAYSIQRQMKEDSWMGHFGSDWKNAPTLSEILTGRIPEGGQSLRTAAQEALDRANRKHSKKLVEKEVVLLLQYQSGELIEINQSNIELAYDFESQEVFWLSSASDAQSIPFLIDAYEKANNSDLMEDLVTAVAVHDDRARTRPFVLGVIESGVDNEVREGAVFWMSRYETMATVRYLDGLAENDRSEDVRENAVFALSRIKMEEALDHLIRLAKYAYDEEVREESRFWLGRRASDELLGDVGDGDDESKLQKQAVFALTQMDDEGVDELIQLAQTHSNPVVRKQAIFWLGQAESDRALDAIIEMLRPGS